MTTDHRAAFHYFGAHSGACVSYTNPMPCQIYAEDIALSLSRQFRGIGHDGMTIAQHGLITTFLMFDLLASFPLPERPVALAHALLHDAAETYTGDIPMPLKTTLRDMWRMMQDAAHGTAPDPLKVVEGKLNQAIWGAFKLAPPTQDIQNKVKICDGQSIAIEMRDVMSPARRQTFLDSGYAFQTPRTDVRLIPLCPEAAHKNFQIGLALIPDFPHLLENEKTASALRVQLRNLAGLVPA